MIAQAEAKGIYDRLVTADLADFLAAEVAAGVALSISCWPPMFLFMSTI